MNHPRWSDGVMATVTSLQNAQPERLIAWAANDLATTQLHLEAIAEDLAHGAWTGLSRDSRDASAAAHYRGAVVATDPADALAQLRRTGAGSCVHPAVQLPPVALLLPGQGSQYERMAYGLYEVEPVFTAALHQVLDLLGSEGERIQRIWASGEDSDLLDQVSCAQPLLFAVEYALAAMVENWGVGVEAFLGHSVGEMVAAAATGVMSLPDAVLLLSERVKAIAAAPPGGMLAVVGRPDEVAPLLAAGVSIAAVNAPRQLMVAGLVGPLAATELRLAAAGVTYCRARASAAFHNPLLATAMAPVSGSIPIRLAAPDRRLVSCFTAADLDLITAGDVGYWHSHPVAPVMFADALSRLLASGDHLLMETGPARGLSTLARQHPAVRAGRSSVLSLLPDAHSGPAVERRTTLEAIAELWRCGYLDLWHSTAAA